MEFQPERYLVLEALSRGGKTKEDVAVMLGVDVRDAEALLASLEANGLVERRLKGLVFKKEVYVLTERGYEVLYSWRAMVLKRVEKAAELRRQGASEEADELLTPVVHILPMLLTLGVLDLALFDAAIGEMALGLEPADVQDLGV